MSHNYFWHKGDYYTQTKGVAMGAKYAPSVANIFLNRWEEEQIFSIRRKNLKLYHRYIDDIVIVWRGTEGELQAFFDEINCNAYGISFSGSWNKRSINYLDLQIYKENGNLNTRTFFKSTDRNGYIPTSSCHHPQWIGNIPKGQLMRIHRNCSNGNDYEEQADIIIKRFVEKGYNKRELINLKEKVKKMDRNTLIEGKPAGNIKKKDKNIGMAFLTGYNRQYKITESIIKKHWSILQSDNKIE